MNVRLEPFICEAGEVAARPIREFLLRVGTEEKHWPAAEVDALLAWPGATFVGVRDERARVIAAGQVLHQGRPFPVEKAFPGCIVDSAVPVEVSIIGIDPAHRRALIRGGVSVLDALVKGIYCGCRDFTDIYELFEDWTIAIFEQFVGLNVERLAPGKHYWCGTAVCPGPQCKLTYPCRIRRRDNEARWQDLRPEFWAYLQQGLVTP